MDATIKKAILANRGGLQNATDEQLMTIWRSLDEPTQKRYLDSVQAKPEKKKAPAAERDEKEADNAAGN